MKGAVPTRSSQMKMTCWNSPLLRVDYSLNLLTDEFRLVAMRSSSSEE